MQKWCRKMFQSELSTFLFTRMLTFALCERERKFIWLLLVKNFGRRCKTPNNK